MDAVENEIKKNSPDVKTRIVQADFISNSNLNFYRDIMNKVKDLDIGLIVLNAGIMNVGYFDKKSGRQLQEMMDVNAYSLCILLKMFLPQLDRRCNSEKTSGVCITSSLAGWATTGGNTTYHATKVFVNYLHRALHKEIQQA